MKISKIKSLFIWDRLFNLYQIGKNSKRQTCSQRYNIQKKISSHNKKERKVANKAKSAGGVQKSNLPSF